MICNGINCFHAFLHCFRVSKVGLISGKLIKGKYCSSKSGSVMMGDLPIQIPIQVEETQGGNCNMRTLFVQLKFKTSLPRALPHIYPKLSCLHLTLNYLLVLAYIGLLWKAG